MKKAILQQQIFINTGTNNTFSGYLEITATENLSLDKVTGTVYFEIRGKMQSEKRTVIVFNVADEVVLLKNQTKQIPFSFKLQENGRNIYYGRNVSLQYSCKITIHVNDEDIEKLDRDLFTKVKSFVTDDNSIKTSTFFRLPTKEDPYEILECTSKFKLQNNFVLSAIVGIIIGVIYMYIYPDFEFTTFPIAFGIAFIILFIFLTHKFINYSLGKVTMHTKHNNDTFICSITRGRKFKLNNQFLFYKVIEKVIDKRGTATTTYEEPMFKSEFKKMPNFKENLNIEFPYPYKKGLSCFEEGNVSVVWRMYLEGTTYLGFIVKYHCDFMVYKKKHNSQLENNT